MAKLIYTDHARERMAVRGMSRRLVQSTVDGADHKKREDDGDTQFIRSVTRGGDKRTAHVIAKPLPEEGRDVWLVKTVWVRGEDDPNPVVKAWRLLLLRVFGRG
ncbi:MAG: DUF4258 domain-containing protein [Chloroflexota bacterium]